MGAKIFQSREPGDWTSAGDASAAVRLTALRGSAWHGQFARVGVGTIPNRGSREGAKKTRARSAELGAGSVYQQGREQDHRRAYGRDADAPKAGCTPFEPFRGQPALDWSAFQTVGRWPRRGAEFD